MARYKDVDSGMKLLAVDLSRQLLPGTFEHALNHLIDQELDLSHFDAHYRNATRGSTAYPPAMLLKVVLFAYSQGIVSSRAMERACRDHVTFIALSGDRVPHFTTLAAFVNQREKDIAQVFNAVLLICLNQGLIGREMFAIDGVKLPSNASKGKSGTRADFHKQLQKLEGATTAMLQRHREQDGNPVEPDQQVKELKRLERLQCEAGKVRDWLAAKPEDRKGSRGKIRKSNRTDIESAKMATSKGVIQGYTGVAAVDAKHQVIVEAQAHGTGSEQELLVSTRWLPTTACASAMNALPPNHDTNRARIRYMTSRAGRRSPRSMHLRTSSSIPRTEPAFVLPARPCSAVARTMTSEGSSATGSVDRIRTVALARCANSA